MKKLFLFAWFLMLSIVAMAQSFIVVDKDGNRICYSAEEVGSVEFTSNPPGFIVNKGASPHIYIFDQIRSAEGLPDYMFAMPDTIYLGADGGGFSFEVKANVAYDATPSNNWLTFVSQEGDQMKYSASGNDDKWRKGYIAFASDDQLLTDTLWIVQAGKADPGEIIDYSFLTLRCLTPYQEYYIGFVNNGGGGGGGSGGTFVVNDGLKTKFRLIDYIDKQWRPIVNNVVVFEPENGTCSLTTANTDASGEVEVGFYPSSMLVSKGSITASATVVTTNDKIETVTATAEYEFKDVYQFECLTPDQEVPKGEEAAVKFKLMRLVNGGWRPAANVTVSAKLDKATFFGSTDVTTVTNIDGEATIRFVPDDVMPCAGSVTATCEVTLGNGRLATSTQKAEFAVAEEFKIEAKVPKIYSTGYENLSAEFVIYEKNKGNWVKNTHDVLVTYTATHGKLSHDWETAQADAYTFFTPDATFSDVNPGSVTASCSIQLSNGKTWTGDATIEILYDSQYRLDCTSPQFINPDKETPVEARLMRNVNGQWEPFAGQDILFSETLGSYFSDIVKTNAEGKAVTNFKMAEGQTTASMDVSYNVVDADGVVHKGFKRIDLVLLKYRLKAMEDEVYIDGTNDYTGMFMFEEYVNGEWKECQNDVPVTFDATGGTVDKNGKFTKGNYFTIATFHPEKDFKEGSLTAHCDIELDGGFVWHGEATIKLLKEELYKIERILPEEDETEISYGETKTVKVRVLKKEDNGYQPVQDVPVYFESNDGTCSPKGQVNTDADGMAQTSFSLNENKYEGKVKAEYHIVDNNNMLHVGSATASFIMPLYKLKAVAPKLAVQNDGSEQKCWFNLLEYKDGKWDDCKKEVEINFEAVGVTLSKTSEKNNGYGVTAAFVVGKDFTEGSVTATCDIPLEDGRTWHGDATVELILDDHLFVRVLPEDAVAGIVPDESQDMVFSLLKLVNGKYQPCKGVDVYFDSQQGTLSSHTVNTNGTGEAATQFTINKDRSTAEVYAHCIFDDEQGIRHDYVEEVEFYVTPYRLKCLTPEVEMKKGDASATVRFELLEYKNGQWVACPEKRLQFSATNGTVQPTYADTNQNGICQTQFSPTTDATEGTVTGMCSIPIVMYGKTVFTWNQSQTAHITITDNGGGGGEGPGGGDIKDEDLKKANKLKDDTYVIDEKEFSLDGADDEVIENVIENNLGEKISMFDWFKEHPVYYTIAWGGIYNYTEDMFGKEIDYLKEKANGNEKLKLSFGAFIDPAGGYSETNVIEFNDENLEKAVFRMDRNSDGTLSVIAYCKRKDGKVGMFKAKTKKSN